MKIRIGIDVGGTFTDAVAIDDATYELVGYTKVPTTHTAEEGVALGIVLAMKQLLTEYSIDPKDVSFIAHGTTQATNALLEGDVSFVGIVGIGSGVEGLRAKADTKIGDIELSKGKHIRTVTSYVDSASDDVHTKVVDAVTELLAQGVEVIVASGTFSVDDPTYENMVLEEALAHEIPCSVGHDISKLYGLKIRTQTAAINASILPKMIETANMTDSSVKKSSISAPLMIMRCDGGVMDVAEVKRRPILTMLSGPAAGVAGALMYEKISNGIFLEVGGTSTDISAIKDGQVVVQYAEVGGHKTYVNSLDVRTVGIAGGSMVRLNQHGVEDVGPRSAHIANLEYACFADPKELVNPKVVLFSPKPGDPADYMYLECENGKKVTLTMTCAANFLGYVKPEDYSNGNPQSVEICLKAVSAMTGLSSEEVAKQILAKGNAKNALVVDQLIKDYKLEKKFTLLIGGGGGASAIVNHLGETMNMPHRIAKNAEVISPIGVALALVRDSVERTILNPTEQDILSIRHEAIEKAVGSGAAPETIEVNIEIDTTRNLVRAIAIGSTELRTKDLLKSDLTDQEIVEKASKFMQSPVEKTKILVHTGELFVVEGIIEKKGFTGLFKKTEKPVFVLDNEGVIRLQKKQGVVRQLNMAHRDESLEAILSKATVYNDGGEIPPDTYILYGKHIRSFTGMLNNKQIIALVNTELNQLPGNTEVLVLCSERQ